MYSRPVHLLGVEVCAAQVHVHDNPLFGLMYNNNSTHLASGVYLSGMPFDQGSAG